jgi:hypothetical protein
MTLSSYNFDNRYRFACLIESNNIKNTKTQLEALVYSSLISKFEFNNSGQGNTFN